MVLRLLPIYDFQKLSLKAEYWGSETSSFFWGEKLPISTTRVRSPKTFLFTEKLYKIFFTKLFTTKCVNIPNKSLRRQISTTRVRSPKTFPPSCFLQKSFTKSFHQKTDHIHNDNARGQIVSSVVLIEGTKKAIFLFPPSAEDCLSKTDIGTQQSCTATTPKNYLKTIKKTKIRMKMEYLQMCKKTKN